MNLIKRKTLTRWLDKTASHLNLIAPKEVEGILLYRPVSKSKEIVWDYIRPVLSAKGAFFPATERLLRIEKNGQSIHLTETIPDRPQVLFGVRPCDGRGIAALDALFIDSEPADPHYAKRRQDSVVIGLACEKEGETCFCTRTGADLDDPTGSDIFLKGTQAGFQVRVHTEKGLCLVQDEWGFVDAEIENNPAAQSPSGELPPMQAWPPQFNAKFWQDMSERCLSCRLCAYVCPTCRCFDVRDEAVPSDNGGQNYERLRCWDSCAGEAYRVIAGGHNPRAEKGQRLKNRFFCKFYYYPEQYGTAACTGCGRCVDSCPVNIDITEVMSYIAEQAN